MPMMLTNRAYEIQAEGLHPGDRCWSASIARQTEDDVGLSDRHVGFYKSKSKAVKATKAALKAASPVADSWWYGEVEYGYIESEVLDGTIEDWGFERDLGVESEFLSE